MVIECAVVGCKRTDMGGRGYCRKHYQRLYRHGDVNGGQLRQPAKGRICSVSDCDRPMKDSGLCIAHVQRLRTKGDVEAHKPVAAKRKKGEPSKGWLVNGYRQVSFPEHPNADKSGCVFQHVVVMSEFLGRPLFPDEEVHHINGVRDDNSIVNLELWSTSHPKGQRIKDKVAWAHEILERYETQ